MNPNILPVSPSPSRAPHLLPQVMTFARATGIVGSDLARPSKMPGHAWGISAQACVRGSELAADEGTTCSRCYARRGRYTTGSVCRAHERRLDGLSHPEWVAAMVFLIYRIHGEHHFRWFDSGDLQDVAHLEKIVAVCRRTPRTAHWLPTHEPFIVGQYLAVAGSFPGNLCVRISADYIEDRPTTATFGLPTSTVHKHRGEPVPAPGFVRGDSIECRAYLREHRCGPCRACWSKKVANVSYALH